MFGANIFLLVVSVIELLLLFVAFQQGKGKWEGLWVILVECIAYAANAVSPDADHVTFRLENGMWIEWIRVLRLDPDVPGPADDAREHDHRGGH